MNAIVALVRANLRRFFNMRANLFFVVALPLMIVLALGLAFGGGGSTSRLGVTDPSPSAASSAMVTAIERVGGVKITRYTSASAMRDDIARKAIDAGWVAVNDGEATTLTWYSANVGNDAKLRAVVESRASEMALADEAVRIVAADTGADEATALGALDRARSAVPVTKVSTTDVGRNAQDDPTTIRAVLAGGQLTLFVFLSSLTGAAYLLASRKLGASRRTIAAPVTTSALIAGEGASRMILAIFQALVIVFGSIILFRVDWKSPLAVTLLCLAMALVGAGAAMILGTVATSEQQVGALGIFGSLVLAALGGSMQPLHFFPSTLRTVALALTPHAWMNDALWKVLVDGGGVADIWVSLIVLVAVGSLLMGIATVLMRRHLR